MRHLKEMVLENWYLKLFSLVIAAALWALIAQESLSEIFFDVPVEYQNVPPRTEVIGDTAKTVQVRLRGPSRSRSRHKLRMGPRFFRAIAPAVMTAPRARARPSSTSSSSDRRKRSYPRSPPAACARRARGSLARSGAPSPSTSPARRSAATSPAHPSAAAPRRRHSAIPMPRRRGRAGRHP